MGSVWAPGARRPKISPEEEAAAEAKAAREAAEKAAAAAADGGGGKVRLSAREIYAQKQADRAAVEKQAALDKAAAEAAAAEAARADPEAPDEIVCPITMQVMADPVQARDGMTYERSAIELWLQVRAPPAAVFLKRSRSTLLFLKNWPLAPFSSYSQSHASSSEAWLKAATSPAAFMPHTTFHAAAACLSSLDSSFSPL